ncbi:MAG: hypothetical protein FJ319_11200 [SAR202 cluster bacterium]|nr:hypothetical protein [SAR202 cluster bacterium]
MVSEQDRKAGETGAWFLYSEQSEPFGQVYRSGADSMPRIGERLTGGAKWDEVEVVAFRELASTCAVRRFQVIVRVIRPKS